MSLENDIAALRKVALFASLSDEEVRHLAFGAEPVSLSSSRWLYRIGQRAEGAIVLVSGSVQLFANEDDRDQSVLLDQPGTIMGETALIAAKAWNNSAASEEGAELLRVPRALFRRVIEEYPDSASRLQAYFAKQIDETLAEIAPAADKLRRTHL